jgi:hypothetical protein
VVENFSAHGREINDKEGEQTVKDDWAERRLHNSCKPFSLSFADEDSVFENSHEFATKSQRMATFALL